MAALVAAFSGMGGDDQRATADRLMSGSSLIWLMVSSVIYLARWTAHSSFCSSRIAPTRRMMASSLGKMPTISVLRLISPLRRSIGSVLCSLARCSFRQGHVGENVFFGIIHDGGELGDLRPDLVGDGAPLGACGFRRLVGKGGGDEGGDDTPTALAGVGKNVPHEVDAGAVEPIVGGAIRKPPTSRSPKLSFA